ncbi:hypothetical protein D3C81_1717020 [compost metagenome]
MDIGSGCGLHLFDRPVDVALVVLMVASAVDHLAFEGLVCPQHTSCLDTDVAGEHDQVDLHLGWLERCELHVEV